MTDRHFKCEDCEVDVEEYIETETNTEFEIHKLNHTLKEFKEMLNDYLHHLGVYNH